MSHHTKIIRLTLISFLMALLLAGNQVSFGQVSAAGTVTVTVTLMDGGGHMDMPLYGYVRVGSFAPSYSDPFTGQLTLSLDQGTDYTIRAYSQGYVTQTRVVNYTSSVASETFSLLPDPDSGCPLGYQPGAEQTQVTVLNEGFESGVFPPAGWQQFIYDASQPIWAASTDKYTGGFSAFHDRISTEDSFYYNALISAPIHIPASGQLTLYHKTNGQSSSSPSSLYLYLYDNVTQQALVSYGGIPIADTWQKATYNLTSFAGRDYSIGFYYYNNNNLSEWYLDDIKVEGIQRTCQVLNGGRITGYVSDSLTKYPLKGATVTQAGLTTETPLSGLYFLWSATGTVQVGASASRHFALAKNVMVTANSVTRQDFALEPGYTLTTAVNGEGAGTITGNNATLYHMGEVVHLTAIPSPGANFTGWSGNGTDDGNRGNNPLALTITGNMTLSAVFGLNPVDVTVTFTDGDSHAGMPLMGVITVRATTTAGGSIDTPYATNPFTGQVTLHLKQATTYTLFASVEGYAYQTKAGRYLTATANESFALLPEPATGCPIGYQLNQQATSIIFSEGFESGVIPPTGWGKNIGWLANTSAHTGSVSAFHDVNPSHSSSDEHYLITPKIHIPANGRLRFYQKVNLRDENYIGGHHVYLSDSSALGYGNYYGEALIPPPAVADTWGEATFDLSSFAGRDLYIFFIHYGWSDDNVTDDQWYIDDVTIEGNPGTCQVQSGGWAAGYVTDALTGSPISGALVTDGTHTATTADDGLYRLWYPAGAMQLTASAPQRLDRSYSIAVAANAVTRQDFALDPVPPVTYTLSVQTNGSGTVIRDNDGPYALDDFVQLTADPADGSHFVAWSGDGIDAAHAADRTVMIKITGNMAVTAQFALNDYSLAVNITGDGTVTKNPDQTAYHLGDKVTLSANPVASTHFVAWSADGIDAEHLTSLEVTITITGDMVIGAEFALNEYTLDVTVINGVGGSVSRSTAGPYHLNDEVTLTANPDASYHFVTWGHDVSGNAASLKVIISGNMSVTAQFSLTEYSLSVDIIGNGTVSKSPDQTVYHLGDDVTLTAAPASNYRFVAWDGDASGNTAAVTLKISGNMVVTARFDSYQADLGITLSAKFNSVAVIRYTIMVTNQGPDPVDGAIIADTFNNGLGSIAWNCTAVGGAVCPNTSGNNTLNETIITLPSGGSLTYIVNARVLSTLGLSNTATVTAPIAEMDTVSGNNTATARLYLLNLPLVARP